MNDDLISRKAVLKQIRKNECEPGYQHVGEDWSVGLCIAESIVEEAESVTNPGDVAEFPSMSTWIPVSERLPEDTERYLVTLANGDIDIGWIRGDEYLWDLVDIDCEYFLSDKRYQVIAWMPLPEPYKEAMR